MHHYSPFILTYFAPIDVSFFRLFRAPDMIDPEYNAVTFTSFDAVRYPFRVSGAGMRRKDECRLDLAQRFVRSAPYLGTEAAYCLRHAL